MVDDNKIIGQVIEDNVSSRSVFSNFENSFQDISNEKLPNLEGHQGYNKLYLKKSPKFYQNLNFINIFTKNVFNP